MVAELRLDRSCGLTGFHRGARVFKFGNHLSGGEIAELAALFAGRTGAELTRCVLKGDLARVDLTEQLVRLVLGIDQNVAGVIVGAGHEFVLVFFVVFLDLFLGHAHSLDGFLYRVACEHFFLDRLELFLEGRLSFVQIALCVQ